MADLAKLLGQSAPAATTEDDLVTVPGGATTVVSSISCCNRGPVDATFRITIADAGAATSNAQYLYYDVPLPVGDTFIATIGVTLEATDIIRVFASTANVTFQAFGIETT